MFIEKWMTADPQTVAPDMTIFRLEGRLPLGFIAEMAAQGYRVASVGG